MKQKCVYCNVDDDNIGFNGQYEPAHRICNNLHNIKSNLILLAAIALILLVGVVINLKSPF